MLRQLLAMTVLALPAAALAKNDPVCRDGLYADEPPFALAQVSSERTFFHGDMNGCPWTLGACSSDSYLVRGDTVVISKILKGYACAYYPGKRGGTAGWLPTRSLILLPADYRPPTATWVGGWTSPGNPALRFSHDLGRLRAAGETHWPGQPIPMGEINGPVTIAGHRGDYGGGFCKVRFTLLGDYLVARDNRMCGGANVSFSGIYTRSD